MLEVTLAVIGSARAGKSTFIQCALDLKKPVTSSYSIKKVSLEGVVYLLRLLELQVDDLRSVKDFGIQWPRTISKEATPRIDGALVLCDVMDPGSLLDVSELLKACFNAAIPTVLVSSKCDSPRKSWRIDQHLIDIVCKNIDGLESFQTSASCPETHKRCVSVILRTIMFGRAEPSTAFTHHSPARTLTNQQHFKTPKTSQMNVVKSRHIRATSELDFSNARNIGSGSLASNASNPNAKARYSEQLNDYSHLAAISPTEASMEPCFQMISYSSGNSDDEVMAMPSSPGSGWPTQVATSVNGLSKTSPPAMSTMVFTSTLETYEYSEEQISDVDLLDLGGKLRSSSESNEAGSTFDELVDRLLSPSMSKLDTKFMAVFLCLYRKFAAPSDLMSAIIIRFEALNGIHYPQILRITSQLRYLNVLTQWISEYPGDFAHPLTRRSITGFISELAGTRIFAIARKEMSAHLNIVANDDDTEWACSDTRRSRASTVGSFLSISSNQSSTSTFNADSPTGDISSDTALDESVQPESARNSTTTSIASSPYRLGSLSKYSFRTLLTSVESAQRQAQLLIPVSRSPLTKIQWHQFMESTDDDVARELTRIDWIMFSSIRPRDLIRHVSLSVHQKEKCKSLENVDRMINHFNHVAFWVANIILLRDKPKHRAKALEKFIGVAWKLRYLNNYNSLGAIVAGINGTAVHRLAQTRELVPSQVQKEFMRLEILMGTQRSHFAYRLAWGNTLSERIPFLPLLRRDLVCAEEGNQTHPGGDTDRINWKKFDVMGEVIVGIQKSQGTPYSTIRQNEDVQRLILDGRFPKDEDELYNRSIQIEGPRAGENVRKMFPWFQR